MAGKEYIVLYLGCKKQRLVKIQLETNNYQDWDEARMLLENINPQTISKIKVGCKTVVELYEQPNLTGARLAVVNDMCDQDKIYEIGCIDNINKVKVTPRSFRVSTFDYYDRIHGIRYCDHHSQCTPNEYCMCQHGQTHPSWCQKSKRRCMAKGYFTYETPVPISTNDQIDQSCLYRELGKTGGPVSHAVVTDLSRRCASDKLNIVEGFSKTVATNYLGFVALVLSIVLVVYYYRKH